MNADRKKASGYRLQGKKEKIRNLYLRPEV